MNGLDILAGLRGAAPAKKPLDMKSPEHLAMKGPAPQAKAAIVVTNWENAYVQLGIAKP